MPADVAARLAQHRCSALGQRRHGGNREIPVVWFFAVLGSGTGTKSMVRIGMPGTPSTVNQPSFSVTPAS